MSLFFMQQSILTQQRLFAFTLLIKIKQKNSVVFVSDNNRTIAAKFGLSLDSYNKYLNKAIEAELLIYSGKNYQLISWDEILKKLGLLEKSNNFMKYINLQDVKSMGLFQLTAWVRECLVLYKLIQQKFKIDKDINKINSFKSILNRKKGETVNYKTIKQFIKEAHSFGMDTENYYNRVKKEQRTSIVTGSHHLANIFGNCHSTMNRCLNNLVKKGFINRTIEKREFKEYDISNHSYDAIKAQYGTNALFIKYSTQHFIQVIGSIITINFGCFA